MEEKSRTQKKKEAEALQVLGEKLVELTDAQLKNIEMPLELMEAVLFAKTTTKHGARKRQMQFIGTLMREIDSDTIREGLAQISLKNRQQTVVHKNIEKQRDELIAGDHVQIEKLIEKHPEADRQKLKQLVRNAKKEISKNLPPKSSRLLFRYLKELMG